MMLSPLVSERIAPPTDVFFCDHHSDCVDSIKLPHEVGEMLMTDKTLILLIGNHKPCGSPGGDRSEKTTGEVVKRGKGWKVCRVQ